MQGLGFLSQSIEKKSASLKVLVESNFEKFVRAKATIDNVYREMANPGQDVEEAGFTRKPHSRQASRQSMHFRKTSGPFGSSGGALLADKRKNALAKDQEYGVLPIKLPLLELKTKVDDVWGPALGGREREDQLKVFMASSDTQRSMFDIGASISECIKRREYETLVEEYGKAKRLADDARLVMESSRSASLSDPDIVTVITTARLWSDIEDQVEDFKRDLWRRLAGTHFTKQPVPEDSKQEEYMEIIGILLELGVEDNPIWVWLFSRYDFLKQKIAGTFERSKVEIEILRRRLSNGDRPTLGQLAAHLRAASLDGRVQPEKPIDSAKVLEAWEHIYACLNALLSTHGGILGDVIEFWETAKSFIDGNAQKSLPNGIDGSSRRHHRLSTDGIKTLGGGARDLLDQIRQNVLAFFTEPPIEDLSQLLTPIPQTPLTPKTPKTPKTPRSATFQPFHETRLKIDLTNIPPPSPKTGDTWEKYAFWPPHSNSLSGVHYLSRILHLVGAASCDMAGLGVDDGRSSVDAYKLLVGGVRERCVQAACAAWNNDCESAIVLEDWTRSPERADLTNFPTRLLNFEGFLISNLQKILYISDVSKKPSSPDIIVPPSSKLLLMVKSQFVGGMYKVINGMKDNAEAPRALDSVDKGGLVVAERDAQAANVASGVVDSSNKNVRVLLSMSNIGGLRNDIVPHLIGMFETNFSVKLSEEPKSLMDVLRQIEGRLFQAYVSPRIARVDALVRSSITSADWAPRTTRPTDARPYVYTILLELVLMHTEVSTTSAPLTTPLLRHLLEEYMASLLEAFKQRPRYSLPALMQATLDVEFMTQTLNNYTTDKASQIQGEIYVLLDRLTDDQARMRLQEELQEMRTILKKLRDGTRAEL
jgi:exocyst complex component 2